MGKHITIRRGYDIKLNGSAGKTVHTPANSGIVAVMPSDFQHVKPKLQVSPGDSIRAGQILFTDKRRPELQFTSPVSGEIAEIILGEKRKIREIRILTDKEDPRYVEFLKAAPASLTREVIIRQLLDSGAWNFIRQRPYSLIADPQTTPKAIFVSCFDTSPLAPDLDFIIRTEPDHFITGLQALQVLSNNQLHLSLPDSDRASDHPAKKAGIDENHIHYFKGPHPAGNVGIQIHHIDPIQKGEVVWYASPQDVIIIGRLFAEGRLRTDRLIAITGNGLSQPGYVRAMAGQKISDLFVQNNIPGHSRIIQGNVLHGEKSSPDDFLSTYTQQITVISEGTEPEFLGWLMPGFKKLSLSKTFFSWLTPNRTYQLDTNLHGEERAFVMTGQYDKVLPMKIYPVFLLKAILARDIEKMEALGIYEVAEEDFALCEFVCTSKIDVQQIIADGLKMMREEG